MKTVLFVCTGNTCRSPMAEFILKDKLKKIGIKDVTVKSRGVKAMRGDVMTEQARRALLKRGIFAEEFYSAILTVYDVKEADMVFAMTQEICSQIGEKAVCIGELIGQNVSDPFGQSDEVYDLTADIIDKACDKIIDILKGVR